MKRISLAFLGVVLAVASLAAQNLIPQQNKKGKWGYVDDNNKVIIDYKYDTALAFVDGRAKVEKGGKWGFIGPNGKEVIKIQYSEIHPWENNRCKVALGGKIKNDELIGAKWGYISYNGDVLLKPEYDKIGPFEDDGVAYVVKGGKYGYINQSFNFIIPCKYTALGKFNDKGFCWVASGGKLVKNKVNGAKYGVVDRKGNIIVKPDYRHLGCFTREIMEANPILAKNMNSKEAKERYKQLQKEAAKGMGKKSFMAALTNSTDDFTDEVKKRTKSLTEKHMAEMAETLDEQELLLLAEAPVFPMLGYEFIKEELFSTLDMSKAPYFAVSNAAFSSESMNPDKSAPWLISSHAIDKIGIITDEGTVILKPGNYSVAFLPTEDLIPVVKVGKNKMEINYVTSTDKSKNSDKLLMKKWIDATGIAPFTNSVAVVPGINSQYIIDRDGNQISAAYQMILPQTDGIHLVKDAFGYGFIDGRGKEIIAPSWNLILPQSNGLFCAQKEKGGNFGYVDASGNYVIEPTYAEARSFVGNSASVKNSEGWGMINTDNSKLISCKWTDIMPVSEHHPSICWVKDGDKWKALDIKSENFAFEGSYHGVGNYTSEGYAVVNDGTGMYGCINKEGSVIIPMRLANAGLIKGCLEHMTANGVASLTDIEAYRYNLSNNPARNGFRLSHTIDNTMWDY